MRLKFFLLTILFVIIFLSLFGILCWLRVGCGGSIVCHATQDYPPNCNEKGKTFVLKKNKNMFFKEQSTVIPDNAFYYLLPYGYETILTYTPVVPIEIATFNGINLEEFVDKTVCIEGKYRFGLPTFFVDPEKLPAEMSEYEQVVADIERIELR